jgi:hypothetical protein
MISLGGKYSRASMFKFSMQQAVSELRRVRRVPRGGASSRKRRRSCGWSHPIVELRSRREVEWS